MLLYTLMPVVFLLGIIMIAMENRIKVNKAASALLMALALWLILMLDANYIFIEKGSGLFAKFMARNPSLADLPIQQQLVRFLSGKMIVENLGDVAETLFFVMSSMLIVELMDKHGGFQSMTKYIASTNKRRLLWGLCFSAFFFSALLDNLAASIVIIAILRKLVFKRSDRLKYACMIIISANAGGSWTPIGDVTTILLWVEGNISAFHQMGSLILPALANMLIPLTIAHFTLFKKGEEFNRTITYETYTNIPDIPLIHRRVIFFIGIGSLALVPLYQHITHLPPFMGVLSGLVILWIYTDIMYSNLRKMKESEKLSIVKLLPDIDMSTILFFLGILMAVAAMNTSGHLSMIATFLDTNIHQPFLISASIGIISSFIDNVALVSATIGMYPLPTTGIMELSEYARHFVADGHFWTFLAYSAVTGGSLLIIGSATGVTVMGMENISFAYYFRKFSILALIGYISGAAVYMLLIA